MNTTRKTFFTESCMNTSLIYLLGKNFSGGERVPGGCQGAIFDAKNFREGCRGGAGGPIVNVHFRVL